jgi:hypothetical protein
MSTTSDSKPDPSCRHTLDHRDKAGSWKVVDRKVVCRECGKFYGHVNQTQEQKPEAF